MKYKFNITLIFVLFSCSFQKLSSDTTTIKDIDHINSKNEIYLQYGDITRVPFTLFYGRQFGRIETSIEDFRAFFKIGFGYIGKRDGLSIPIGLAIRSGDGFGLEASIFMVYGDTNTVSIKGYNQVKKYHIDFPFTLSLVADSDNFLFKFSLGYVIRNEVGSEGVLGFSGGYRF